MINLSASKKTDTINLDVKPVTNVHIGDMGEKHHKPRTREIDEGVTVVYPDGEGEENQEENPYANLKQEDLE